jgi:LuxR family maltose regulon positive regulatory protein
MPNYPARRDTSASGDPPALPSDHELLVTKLARPAVAANLVPRPRLTEQLQRGRHRPLTLLAAPAGFGKTTLLATWLEHALLPAAWVSLEPADDDLARFWSYLFTAVARVQPGCGAAALPLLHSSTLAPPPPIETALTAWINALAALPHEVALVLDDYHLIATPAIHRSVAYLLEHLPPALHLIIATRADPPLPLARLRARGHLTEIRAADLRFTAAEAAAFLTRAPGLALAAADIAALAARTEGWIAGLHLAALALQGHPDGAGFVMAFAGSHRYIIDYLVEEVLARQPAPVQTFLLQTAILERLHGALCTAIVGGPGDEAGGQAMLEHLEQANLFLVPLDDERRWYRYHQLFAEALRHRLQRDHPALVPELHQRASAWYERQGLLREAVQHALAAADFAQAARLVEQTFTALVRRGEIATLHRWVAALPEERVRTNVELAVLQGWLLFARGQHEAAERHLQAIERTLPAETAGQAAIKGRVAAIRASIAITQRDLPRTIALARLALESLPPESLARAYAAWYLGKAHWLSGALAAARRALTEAVRISWEVNHPYAVFLVIHDLGQLQVQQGQLHQAEQTYRQALEQALEQGGPQPALGPAYVGRGNLAREWNQLDAATTLLQEGLALCEQTGNTQAILQAYIGLAFIQQAQGDADGARARLRQARQIQARQPHPPPGGPQVEAAQAWLALRQGDVAAAAEWARSSGLSLDQKLTHLREREYLTVVRVLLAQGRPAEAARWLATLRPLAEAQGRAGSVIELLMLQAEALHASGDTSQAIERLAHALALAEPEGYVRLFVDEGAAIAHLLGQLRRRRPAAPSGATGYREHLLALLGGPADEVGPPSAVAVPTAAPPALVEPLSERELAVLRLIIAGCSNREIAERLVIAVSTVKWYVNAIYGKLQVESRTKAIARARELDIG